MKKIICVLFLLLVAGVVNAEGEGTVMPTTVQQDQIPLWSTVVVPVCDGACVEGNQGVWQVQISNVGRVPFQITALSLIDSDGVAFAVADVSDKNVIISAGETRAVNVAGIVPPPSRGSTLYYLVNYGVGNTVVPDRSFRRMVVLPLSDVECTSNDFCGENKICANYRCMPYSLFNSSEVPAPENKMSAESFQNVLLTVIIVLFVLTFLLHFVKRKHK